MTCVQRRAARRSLPPALATSVRVESAWTGSVGAGGANDKVTVRAFDTATGSVVLDLKRLTPSTGYAIAIQRGTCASPRTRIVAAGTLKKSASGTLATTRALTPAQVAAIRLAAIGTRRISVKVGTGSAARCATLARSLAVTPQVWFAPIPGWSALPFTGATDYKALFDATAPWQRVAGRTHVFKFYTQWITQPHAGGATDAELRREFAALKARDIAIAIEFGPLAPEGGCGVDVEGFMGGAQQALLVIGRIASLDGTVRYIALDEPLYGAVFYDGTNACHWTVEKTAREVARFVREVHAVYPSIVIGDIEPLTGDGTAARYEEWMAAYRKAAGAPLPFFHLDLDWGRSDWAAASLRLQAYARGHGVRFGIIYNSGLASSDAEWLAAAQAHILTNELDGAGPPDDAIFQSWTDHPDRVLPESGPVTFTHLIGDYVRTRTAMTVVGTPAMSGGTIAVTGTVRTLGGDPVAGGSVTLSVTPRDGPYQVLEFTGTVPAGVSEAVIGIRANTEGAGPGSADLTFYEIGYAESGPNLVPNARFDQGLDYWGPPAGDGSLAAVPGDRGSGSMLRAVVTPTQTLLSNSGSFAVTPGAQYRFWVAARIPEASIGSAYIAPIFLKADQSEVRRDIHPLAPAPVPVGNATTDAIGAFSATTVVLEAGRYHLRAGYAGDDARWPARAAVDGVIP